MARAYVPLYFSYAEQLAMLPDDERGQLILALLEYAQTGAIPAFAPASATAMLFSCMRSQTDRDVEKYAERCEKSRQNALSGWDKRHADACDRMQTHATAAKDKEKEKEKEKEKDTDTLFAQFWAVYPKKRDKAKAAKAFANLQPDETLLAEILTALDWQTKTPEWSKDGGQFVPYPATYLNGRRWEDESPQNDAPARSDTPKLRWITNENGQREAVYDE